MGAIPSMLGIGQSPGAQGVNYQAGNANLVQPTTAGQVQAAYGQTQTGLDAQRAFINALMAQNGVGAQTNALGQQQALQNALSSINGAGNLAQQGQATNALQAQMQGLGGVGNLGSTFAQQQALANQFGGLANGTGPNPALAQLAQSTGANTANQAALMASQRGAGANPGLIARMAAEQGAANQQAAAGQAATLAAQQQIAGMQGLQGQQGLMANTAQAQIAAQQAQNQAAANLALQQVGVQQAQNAAVQGQANQLVGQQQGALNAYNQAAQGQQSNLLGAIANQNAANVNMQSNINNINQRQAAVGAGQQAALIGGALNAAGGISGLGMSGSAIPGGSDALTMPSMNAVSAPSGPSLGANTTFAKPNIPGYASGGGVQSQAAMPPTAGEAITSIPKVSKVGPKSTFGKKLHSARLVKPGFAKGGGMPNAKAGGHVPGKPKVGGTVDTEKNDTVHALLSPGEIVIPRSVTKGNNPVNDSAKFVAAIMSRKGKR